jgi:hypothetical protein
MKKSKKSYKKGVDFHFFTTRYGFLDFVCDLGLRRKGAIRDTFPVV